MKPLEEILQDYCNIVDREILQRGLVKDDKIEEDYLFLLVPYYQLRGALTAHGVIQVGTMSEFPELPNRCCGHCDKWSPGPGLARFGGKMSAVYGICLELLHEFPEKPGSCISRADISTECSKFYSSSRCPKCYAQFGWMMDGSGKYDTSKCKECGWPE